MDGLLIDSFLCENGCVVEKLFHIHFPIPRAFGQVRRAIMLRLESVVLFSLLLSLSSKTLFYKPYPYRG